MKIKHFFLGIILLTSSVVFPQGGGAGTTSTLSITSAGLTKGSTATRANKLYIPKNYNANTPAGLIVNYHGTTQTPAGMQQMCQMDKYADTYNFIVVYPEGLVQPNSGNKTAWNVLGTRQEFMDTDYIFTVDLINEIKKLYNVNPCKIFATGFSIGGFMTHVVGTEMSDIFAAIAPHSGNKGRASTSTPTHPMPALILHGDADGTVAIRQADVDYWVSFDKCAAITAASYPTACQTDAANVAFNEYPNGTNGSVVQRYTIKGGGHTWHKDASCTIVTFFSQWCLDNLKGTPPACVQPSVTAQPTPKTICAGANTTFGITATGDGLTYQWQVDNGSGTFTNLTNAAPYSTVTTATLTITGATAGMNGYKYKCVVSGTCTPATPATSNQAILTIAAAPTATVSGDATICSGTSTTITIALTGTGPWTVTKAVNGANQAPVSPPSSPYTFNASASGVITVATLTDNNGCSGTSSGSATVNVVTAITTSNKTEVCNGGNTDYVVEFDVAGGDTATYAVTGGTGTFTTPTHFKSDPIASGASYSFTITDVYSCGTSPVVSGTKTCGTAACNASATISGDATICPGASATISIALTGTSPWTITYAIGGTNQAPVTATSSPYTFAASAAGVYTVSSVDDGTCSGGTTNGSATITENTAITTSNLTETCNGGNTDYVVEFDISGGDGTYTVTGGTMTTTTHYTSNPIASGTSYSITVSDSYNCNPIPVTGTKTCSGTPPPNCTGSISGGGTVCPATSTTTNITISATGTAPWTVVYAIDGVDQPAATLPTSPQVVPASAAGVYTLTSVTDNTGCTASVSGSVTVTQNCPAACTGSISGGGTICPATSTTTNITISATGTAPWTVVYAIDGVDQPAATLPTSPQVVPASAAGVYTLTSVTDNTGCTASVSGSVTVTQNCPAACTGSISGGGTVCPATSTTTNITISATGTAPWTVVYAIDGVDQPAATLPTSPQVVPASAAGVYTLTSVTDNTGCTASVSGSVTVTQNCPTPGCTATAAISGNTTICSGTSATISIALAGTAPWSFAYTINGGSPITATSTSSSYTLSASTAGTYALAGVTDGTSCSGTTSGSATVVVNSAITASSAIATCSVNNSTYTVEFDISGGNPASYTVSGGTITNGNHFTSNPINSGTAYSFSVNDANNCTPVTVTGTKTCVNTGPCNATATMSGGGTICNGSTSTLTVALTGQAPWNFTIDPGNITVTNQNTSPFTITTTVAGTFSVTAIADATCTGTSSGSAIVTSCYVGPPPTATGVEENSTLQNIIIYPNPTSGDINISIKNASFNELQITVVDVLGTEVYHNIEKGISSDYLKQINLGNLSSGMYYINLSNGTDTVISKLMIQ